MKNLGISEKVKERLLELADEKYKEFHSTLCKGIKTELLGVRVPVLRNYAKELYKAYTIEELSTIGEEYYEEVMLKGMIIGLQTKADFKDITKQIEAFVPKIDNWAICDTFCAGLKITKKHKTEMYDFIEKYLKSDKEFEIRFGLVMLLDYYIEEEYINEVLKICDSIEHEGYYVKMAVAWLISVALMKYYDLTIKYLKNSKLDDFTYNKALQKAIESYRITEEQKNNLRKMKR